MEATENYLSLDLSVLLNVSEVTFDAYTQNSLYEAQNTNFVVSDTKFNVSIAKGLFNIIQDKTKGDSDTSRMDMVELGEFGFDNNLVFRVHRSSINFNHISVHSHFINDIDARLVYTSFWYQKTQRFYNMYIDIKGDIYWNTYATTNMDVQNVTLNVSQSTSGFWYTSSWAFEGEMNLAKHIYSNIYAFTDVDAPVRFGIINIAGNANITISNATFDQVYTGASNVIIGFINNKNIFFL